MIPSGATHRIETLGSWIRFYRRSSAHGRWMFWHPEKGFWVESTYSRNWPRLKPIKTRETIAEKFLKAF